MRKFAAVTRSAILIHLSRVTAEKYQENAVVSAVLLIITIAGVFKTVT